MYFQKPDALPLNPAPGHHATRPGKLKWRLVKVKFSPGLCFDLSIHSPDRTARSDRYVNLLRVEPEHIDHDQLALVLGRVQAPVCLPR